MAIKTVQLKKPHTQLEVAGQVFNDGNITVEVYIKLVKLNPNFGELFTVVSDEDATQTNNVEEKQQSRRRGNSANAGGDSSES